MFKHHSIFFAIILSFFNAFAFATVDIASAKILLPKGAQVSFLAKNLNTGEIIADFRSDEFMLPASTQKVFTALAAKLALPADFRFQTALLTNGRVENGVLQGDLIAKFTGDPTLTSGQLFTLVGELKKQGIRKIQGNLIMDTAVFTSHDKGAGWIWNDLTMCFNAPPSAVNIDHNCFDVQLDATAAVGNLIKVNVPAIYPVQVFSQAYIADKSNAGNCLLDVSVNDNNRYLVKGCYAQQPQPFGLSFAVQDPTHYGSLILQSYLKRHGISFNGQAQLATAPQQGTLLAEHFSNALSDLIKRMMKKSDNQIADSLFRTIGNQLQNRPASFPQASIAVRNLLTKQAGIQFENSVMVDGSGLSRHNQISAQIMLQALEFIAKNEDRLQLFADFPQAGVDGTLAGRGSMTMEPLAKNLIAKTGALKGVYNLAGFLTNARGERIAFVQFISGYSTGELDSKTKRAGLNQFENQIYMGLYNE